MLFVFLVYLLKFGGSNWTNDTISCSFFLWNLNFGTLTYERNFVLVYVLIFLTINLGNDNQPREYSFGMVFTQRHGTLSSYHQAWSGSCYTSDPDMIFQVYSLLTDQKLSVSRKN